MQTTAIQKQLNALWTAQDVAEHFNVTPMAIYLWRERGLPCVILPGTSRPAVRFVPADVREWTHKHGIKPKKIKRYRPAA